MTVCRATLLWDGPADDALWLLVDPLPEYWQLEPVDGSGAIVLVRALDEDEMPTAAVVGVAILDVQRFEAWDALPDLPLRWAIGEDEPRPLADVLRRAQTALRGQSVPGTDGATE
jgi:hypothetical protein